MKLITKEQHEKLLANGRRQADRRGSPGELDFAPIVKLFNPYGAGTWLITEIDPEDHDIAWCLADLGMGFAEFGTVRLSELAGLRHQFGFPLIERDRHWEPAGPISAYISASVPAGRIVDPLPAATEV